MMPVVAVDLGGTKLVSAQVDESGTCGTAIRVPTPAREGPSAVLDALVDLVLNVVDGGRIEGVGIGAAGAIGPGSGRVVSATDSIAGWRGTDIAGEVSERLRAAGSGSVPVEVVNDVNAHAAGEAWTGSLRGVASALVVAAGTGIGGALVLDGRVLTGCRGLAGDLGHMPMPGAERLRCGCGALGHLEGIASGPAMARLFRELDGSHARARTGEQIASLAKSGDPVALRAVRTTAAALGRGIAGAVAVLDPQAVLITGGLTGIGELWWHEVERAVRRHVLEVQQSIPLLRAELGSCAALVGAARAFWLRDSA